MPLLMTTLGSVTADGGLLIMPKNRAEMLTGYFLDSLETTARTAMRFRDLPEEVSPAPEAEKKQKDEERKLASFPKLMESTRRLKNIVSEDDGSDLVVERLLLTIDSLFLENLITCAWERSIAEIARRRKLLREQVIDTCLPEEQVLPDILKHELDRIYTIAEKSCKAFSGEDFPGRSGYSPFVLPETDEYIESGNNKGENRFLEQKKSISTGKSLEAAFFDILTVDRGIFSIPRVRYRGLPGILLLPGNAVGTYDKTGDLLLLPYSVLNDHVFEHLLPAFASFRWLSDHNGKLLNMWGDIIGGRGARTVLELETSFREAYSSWVMSELQGGNRDESVSTLGAMLKAEGAFAYHSA